MVPRAYDKWRNITQGNILKFVKSGSNLWHLRHNHPFLPLWDQRDTPPAWSVPPRMHAARSPAPGRGAAQTERCWQPRSRRNLAIARGKEKSGFTSNSDITYKLGEMQASDERFTIILPEKIVNRKHKNYYKIRPFKKKCIDRWR